MTLLARLLGFYMDGVSHRADQLIFTPMGQNSVSGHYKRLPQFICGMAPWHKELSKIADKSVKCKSVWGHGFAYLPLVV